MAKIKWHFKAKQLFRNYVENASIEFGKSTAIRWQRERQTIEWRLERYPTSYPPERLLQGHSIPFRQCLMMNRRFKLIYFYDEAKDTVTIMDIWDTRMEPQTLIRRIRQ